MKKRNIWKNINPPLELHEDERGKIVDIFYKENINHVAVINFKPNAVRGNHYHKQTIQHVLVTKGILEYWYKSLNSNSPARCEILKEGDLISTPPLEIHAFRVFRNTQMMVFSQGLRGGKDYESDTFRLKKPIL